MDLTQSNQGVGLLKCLFSHPNRNNSSSFFLGQTPQFQRHKSKYCASFTILGNNSAGLKAKKDSLNTIIKMFETPSCITLQETKLAKNAVFSLENYQIFQKNRNGSGGGLLTAVDPALNPMLISTRNDEDEILTVRL